MKNINDLWYSDDLKVLIKCPVEKKGKIIVPEGTIGIMQNAFKGCSIDNVILPSTLKRIGTKAFANSQLRGIEMPEGLSYLGRECFKSCIKLSYAKVPGSIGILPNGTFAECMTLKEVLLSDSGLIIIEDKCFADCLSLETIVIPSSVHTIGRKAFSFCLNLWKVVIKSKTLDVNQEMFEGCFKDIIIEKTYNFKAFVRKKSHKQKKITVIKKNIFSGIKDDLMLRLPDTIVQIDEYAFYNSSGLSEIEIPGSVKSIPRYTFAGCTGLSILTIDKGVEQIEEYAFAGCTNLTSLVLPDSIIAIGTEAFSGCTSLRHITLSKHAIVDEDAFKGVSEDFQIAYIENEKNDG